MADFLNIGVSGLLAFKNALATTSHNISNVNTPGYSRQRADMATRIPTPTGGGFIGSGVNVISIERIQDSFATQQVRTQTSAKSYFDTYHTQASQIDNLLADPKAGLAPTLQNFFDAMQGVTDNPSSIPARQVLLSESGSLVERFHSIEDRLVSLRDEANTRLKTIVSEVNSYAQGLAKMNDDIANAMGQGAGQPPNDLLDKRDELLRKLAEKVPVSTVEQDNGMVNVFIGNGQSLVIGNRDKPLGVTPNLYDPSRFEVALQNGKGPIVSDFLKKGGEIGAILQFRSEMLDPAQNSLGRVAMGLADAINTQHEQGLDLSDNLGGKFFDLKGLQGSPLNAVPASTNTAPNPGNITYEVTDVSKLTTSDYRLDYDGTNYTLYRLSDNTAVATTAAAAPTTLSAASDGIQVTIPAAPASGNSYSIKPTRQAARDINTLISDAKKVAVAGPLRTQLSGANLGDAKITNPDVSSPTNLSTVISRTVTLQYDQAAGNFVVNDGVNPAGTIAYNPSVDSGKQFDLGAYNATYAGVKFTVTGTPLNNDKFTIEKNANAVSDNRNGLKLAQVQTTGVLDGGSSDIRTAYGQMVSDVGSKTHQLDIKSQSQSAILDQAVQHRESISGVNLDEEAANLVRLQQAYQASAQVISTAKSLFDTLINAVR